MHKLYATGHRTITIKHTAQLQLHYITLNYLSLHHTTLDYATLHYNYNYNHHHKHNHNYTT